MKREIWISCNNKNLYDRGMIYFPDGHKEEMFSFPNRSGVIPSSWLGRPGDFFLPDYAIRWIYSEHVIKLRLSEEDESIVVHNERNVPVYLYGYQILLPGESCEIVGEPDAGQLELLKNSSVTGFFRFTDTSDCNMRAYIDRTGMLLYYYRPKNKYDVRFAFLDPQGNCPFLETFIDIKGCHVSNQTNAKEVVLRKFLKSYTFTSIK